MHDLEKIQAHAGRLSSEHFGDWYTGLKSKNAPKNLCAFMYIRCDSAVLRMVKNTLKISDCI